MDAVSECEPKSVEAKRARLLVIEDDADIRSALSQLLEGEGYEVWTAGDAQTAKQLLDQADPDLILLDLMLPDADGLVLCSELKARRDVPIIICSGTPRKSDSILGLRLGADDFIAKPYDIDDLEARVDAVLRRAGHRGPVNHRNGDAYRVGALTIDRRRPQVSVDGHELQLTPTEYRLLSALASQPDTALSRPELAQLVWGYSDALHGRALDVNIRRLRVKLASGGLVSPSIISVRGYGYKLLR
jgi:DNA-binding response OmpR family regulator